MLPQLTHECDLGGKIVALAPITVTTLTARKALKLALKSLLKLPACRNYPDIIWGISHQNTEKS